MDGNGLVTNDSKGASSSLRNWSHGIDQVLEGQTFHWVLEGQTFHWVLAAQAFHSLLGCQGEMF